MSDELEQRIARLEEQVFGNESETDDKVMDKLAFLQSKLRDAGEQFEEFQQRVESVEQKMERLQSEEDIIEEMEQIRKDINAERDEIESEFADAYTLLDAVDERLDEIGDEKEDIQNVLEEIYEATDVIVDKIQEPKETLATVQMWLQFHNTRVVTEKIPACEEAEMLMELYEEAYKLDDEMWQDVNAILLTYVQNAEDWSERSGIDFTESPEMFRIHLAEQWQERQVGELPEEDKSEILELPMNFDNADVPESAQHLDEIIGQLVDGSGVEDPLEVYNDIMEEHGHTHLSFLLMMRELGDMDGLREKARKLIESFQVSDEEYERKLQKEKLRNEVE